MGRPITGKARTLKVYVSVDMEGITSFMGHEIEDIWLDDELTGEIGLLHAAAAAYGVPVALLTGTTQPAPK
jgi:D-aminopeptidase